MSKQSIRIGGASGYWGDSAKSTPQLLSSGNVDFIVYDYLAEITMSIMARARAKNPQTGYALDFISAVMKPNLAKIADQGVRIISNAGGVNPMACAEALREIIAELGLSLKVACVVGDDLLAQADQLADANHQEMFSGTPFPPLDKLASINAYLGAFPVASALDKGADIVITGRCVDSAVTLGACIHSFGWSTEDFDQLAMGSLAGHIIECGAQATGGNFTDWHQVKSIESIGYPIAEIGPNGEFICTKPTNTGGMVSCATVAEQLVYEIGDPQAYLLPDVVCDFSQVQLKQVAEDQVSVSGAKGRAAPDSYKVCATYADQFRGGLMFTYYGIEADKKAQTMADGVFASARQLFRHLQMPDFSDTSVEILGAESQYGEHAQISSSREVVVKIAAKHPQAAGIGIMLKESVALGLASPPGLSGFQGSRPKPSPVVRLFSFALPKTSAALQIKIHLDNGQIDFTDAVGQAFDASTIHRPQEPMVPSPAGQIEVPLIKLAWGRSGDKGNKANVGIIARQPEYLPFIYAALTESVVAGRFSHFLPADSSAEGAQSVERFLMPGINGINFLIHDVLGGGGMASIRNDAQGKGYAQLLLDTMIPVTDSIAKQINN